MYHLKRENVIKITASEGKKERLLAEGFTLISEEKAVQKKSARKKKEDADDGAGEDGAAE